MTLLIIIAFITFFIISYAVGLQHGGKSTEENLLAQLYSLSHFLDGEAKKTCDEIFNNLDKIGFIAEADIKQKINLYRNESN